LKIDFSADPTVFLEEQIDYALLHISKIASTIFNMNEEEKNIVIFKLFSDMIWDKNIIGSDNTKKRAALNESIS